MLLTFTTSRKDTLTLEAEDIAESDFLDVLQTVEVGEKDGTAIIPARFKPCPVICRNTGKAGGKKCKGERLHRLSANVEAMTGLGVDIDGASEARVLELLHSLQAKGLKFFVWETFSHSPPDDARARILIPFHKEMRLNSVSQWSRGAWPALIRFLGLDGVVEADQACRDPARVYYLPRKPAEDATRDAFLVDGAPLNWEEVIGEAGQEFEKVAEVALQPTPEEDPSRPVDMDALREKLGNTKSAWVRPLMLRVLRGEAPTPPPEKRKKGEPARYDAWLRVTSTLSLACEDWMSSEALIALLRPAHMAEVSASPSDHTPWETVVQLLASARTSAPIKRAEKKAREAMAEESFFRLLERRYPPRAITTSEAQAPEISLDVAPRSIERPVEAITEPSTEEEPEHVDEDPESWARGLKLKKTKDGEVIASTVSNVTQILTKHPAWKGALRYNEYKRRLEVGRCPANLSGEVEQFQDHHATRAADWLDKAERINMPVSDDKVLKRMVSIAYDNPYDPLKDYVHRLKWDGTPRLDTMLEVYFGAPLADQFGTDITQYVRAVSRRFMVSCIARALVPGEKVDTVLELEGAQGVKKTSGLKALVGAEFFFNSEIDLGSKDAMASAGQSWVIELGERASMSKSDTAKLKHFLSREMDNYRPPYQRGEFESPRRAVFVGTTNDKEYLKDVTGNRRHWPVQCGNVNRGALRRDRNQLWAEAKAIYDAASTCKDCKGQDERCSIHRWWLTLEEEAQAKEQTEDRMEADPLVESITQHFLAMRPEARPKRVQLLDILKACNLDVSKHDPRVSKVLVARMGFVKTREHRFGHRTYFYVLPAWLREAPTSGRSAPNALHPNQPQKQAQA